MSASLYGILGLDTNTLSQVTSSKRLHSDDISQMLLFRLLEKSVSTHFRKKQFCKRLKLKNKLQTINQFRLAQKLFNFIAKTSLKIDRFNECSLTEANRTQEIRLDLDIQHVSAMLEHMPVYVRDLILAVDHPFLSIQNGNQARIDEADLEREKNHHEGKMQTKLFPFMMADLADYEQEPLDFLKELQLPFNALHRFMIDDVAEFE